MNNQDSRPTGWIFLFLLFFTICWPDKSYGAVELGFSVFYISELAIIFLPVAYLLYPRRESVMASTRLRVSIIIFFVTLGSVGLVKSAFLGDSLIGVLRDARHVVPLLSGLALIFLGMRIKAGGVWITVLLGLSCSYLLSLLFFVFNVDPIFISTKEAEIEVASMVTGRLSNMNTSLSILFLCVLIAWKRNQAYKKYFVLVLLVSFLSLTVSLLSFNRTILVMYPIVLLAFMLFHFNIWKAVCIVGLVIISAVGVVFTYSTNDAIRRQVDHRILSLQYGTDVFLEAGYYGTRDVMYGNYVDLVAEYWFAGTPYFVPKSYAKGSGGELRPVFVTDISFLSILLKFGVWSLIGFLWVLRCMFGEAMLALRRLKGSPPSSKGLVHAFIMSFIFYLPVSLNSDVLTRQPPIFFLSMLLIFSIVGISGSTVRKAGSI